MDGTISSPTRGEQVTSLSHRLTQTGSFVRNEHYDLVHSYNVRSAWALLTLGRLLGEKKYENVALANADWTVAQQVANGFFLNNVFEPGCNANTHGIAYVLQGLIEIHCISGGASYLAAVRRAAEQLVSVYASQAPASLSEIGENWEFAARHLCLTGYAQLAIVFFKLYGLDGDKRFLNAELNLLDDVAATQNLMSPEKPYYGGIKGSRPYLRQVCPAAISKLGNKILYRCTARQAGSAECPDGSPSSSTIRWLTTPPGSST